VHNLVRRVLLTPDGVSFRAGRAPDEARSEFLASRDNWFRPVQARTGPDGALWIVDMYRFVIEHPRWIPPDRLAKLDVRAGADKGRIYRIYPRDATLPPIRDLTKLSSAKLAAALDTKNGTERDRIHQELVFSSGKKRSTSARPDETTVAALKGIALRSSNPAARLQALSVLDGLHAVSAQALEATLEDAAPEVVANAVRLSEPFLGVDSALTEKFLTLVSSASAVVRFQVALSLGEWNDPQAGSALGELARRDSADTWMRAAILSSASHRPVEVLKAVSGPLSDLSASG